MFSGVPPGSVVDQDVDSRKECEYLLVKSVNFFRNGDVGLYGIGLYTVLCGELPCKLERPFGIGTVSQRQMDAFRGKNPAIPAPIPLVPPVIIAILSVSCKFMSKNLLYLN